MIPSSCASKGITVRRLPGKTVDITPCERKAGGKSIDYAFS